MYLLCMEIEKKKGRVKERDLAKGKMYKHQIADVLKIHSGKKKNYKGTIFRALKQVICNMGIMKAF